MPTKSANLTVKIEPEVKKQAEDILSVLGIPVSKAINMFYKQIILQGGIPFSVKLPEVPLNIGLISAEQLDAELEEGYRDVMKGKSRPAEKVFENMRRDYVYKCTPSKSLSGLKWICAEFLNISRLRRFLLKMPLTN